MKVNGVTIVGIEFAYDGCHKIYVIENIEERKDAIKYGYNIHPIEQLENTWNRSCHLRFIHNWALNKTYVNQFEDAEFEE